MAKGADGIWRAEPQPRMLAHRGASGSAPENTLAAFRRGAELGARWVEFDATLIADGTVVLHHDETLERCTDATGPVAALTRADLAGIDAGSWFAPAFAGERLPTLDAALDYLVSLGLSANLELKPTGGADAGLALAGAVARALEGRVLPRALTVSSFDHAALARFHMLAPSVPVAPLWHVPGEDWAEVAHTLGAEAVHIGAAAATPALATAAHAAGLAMRCFTVNDRAEAGRLAAMGVDAIFTDHPERFLADPAWRADQT